MKNAIVLCSGGIDSVVTSHYVKRKLKYDKLIILFFNYSQRTLQSERKFSKLCANNLKARFKEIKINVIKSIDSSLLTNSKKIRRVDKKGLKDTKKESEKYYVPFRNGIFLSYAIALAESLKTKEKKDFDIFVGFKNEGKEWYPDTTKGFIEEFNKLGRFSSLNPKIFAPLIKKDKEDVIKIGEELGVNFRETHSCYSSNVQCGTCLACRLRQEGFYWAGIADKTVYLSK